MKYALIVLALVACKKDEARPPPAPAVEAKPVTPAEPEAKPTAPSTKDVVVTPKGDKFEAGDGRFTILLPDKPKADVDTNNAVLGGPWTKVE